MAGIEDLGQGGIVLHIEVQLRPGCARTDGGEIELGKLRATVCFDYCFHSAKLRKKHEKTKVSGRYLPHNSS